MNLIDKAKQLGEGIEEITNWIGMGGVVVSQEEAQSRADVCNACPNNVSVGFAKDSVAKAARRILEIKNKIGLRVNGEKSLGQCRTCGCVLRLLIWEEQKRIEPFLDKERSNLPERCWKLKKP